MKAARLQLDLCDFGVIGVCKGIIHVVANGGDVSPGRRILRPHLSRDLLREGLTSLGPCCLVSHALSFSGSMSTKTLLQSLRSLTRPIAASTALMATCPTAAVAAAMTRASTTTRFSRAASWVSTWSLTMRGDGIIRAETPVKVEATTEKRISNIFSRMTLSLSWCERKFFRSWESLIEGSEVVELGGILSLQ